MSSSLCRSARQLVHITRQQGPRPILPSVTYQNLAGPSSFTRPLSTTVPVWKKSTKSSSKGGKAVSRQEVENVDYENADLDKTLGKVGAQMEKAVGWAKSVVYESVERGRGRVSPCTYQDDGDETTHVTNVSYTRLGEGHDTRSRNDTSECRCFSHSQAKYPLRGSLGYRCKLHSSNS
jgi:hypothetical protein